MYAIVDIQGQQFKVSANQKIYVHRLTADEGTDIDIDKVLLIDDEKEVLIGTPFVEGAIIYAKVLKHLKGDKVVVFKKKRRKGYRVKKGHRQELSQLIIEEIIEKNAKKREKAEKPVAKEEPAPEKQPKKKEQTDDTFEMKAPVAKTKTVRKKKADTEGTEEKPKRTRKTVTTDSSEKTKEAKPKKPRAKKSEE